MRGAAGPVSMDSSSRSTTIRPRPTSFRPDRPGEESVAVRYKIVGRCSRRGECLNALRCVLTQEERDVGRLRLDLVWHCAAIAGAVRTLDEEEVRKERRCDSLIRVGVGCPRVLEGTSSRHGDGERWKHICVRPGAADDCLDLAYHPVLVTIPSVLNSEIGVRMKSSFG